MKFNLIIFDLDGTLYRFDNGNSATFTSSKFYADIKEKVYSFFMRQFGISRKQAEAEYQRIKEKYRGEVSLGVEKESGISRYEYFGNTWNLNPAEYLSKNGNLESILTRISSKRVVLTSAPRIWAESALSYLGVLPLFEEIFTGEPDIRKPNPLAFKQILKKYRVSAKRGLSVGDQVSSDIIPAKSLGMKTILIGDRSSEADVCIDSLEQLNEAIRRLENEKDNN